MQHAATLGVKDALFQKAVELSHILAETEELRDYIAAETAMLNDDEVLELRLRVDETEWALKEGQNDPNSDGSALMTKMYLAKGKWQKHPKVRAYYHAQKQLEVLLAKLNEVITFPITGEQDPEDESCSGCTTT